MVTARTTGAMSSGTLTNSIGPIVANHRGPITPVTDPPPVQVRSEPGTRDIDLADVVGKRLSVIRADST